jgi:dTDP-4-amino-4,6-dideoxygalactose transaminase
MGEEEARAAAEVVASGWLIQGRRVAELEERFAAMVGVGHGVAVNSGSSALLVAMGALGIGPGDEVVCPDMTFVSTASAALFLGARPVFADVEMTYYGMDAADLERVLSPRTRAIVPVHYAGHSAEMEGILEVAERQGVPVLEDAAESHLSRYRGGTFTGALGRIAIFSFTPSKPMTTGEGGMIVTDDAALADRCRLFRNFGDRGKFQWDGLGFNFRMSEVMGAVGLAQLDRLEAAVARRRALARRYTEALTGRSGIIVPKERTPVDANYQLYTIRIARKDGIPSRDRVMRELAVRGVGTRLYYPSLHHQGVFRDGGPYDDADYPDAMEYERTALSLPIFPGLTEKEQDYVIENLLRVLETAAVPSTDEEGR